MEAGNIFWEEVVLALYAEGNYTHATYLPLFFEAKLMSPERHSRASYSMDRHPQHLSALVTLTNPKKKAHQCRAAPDKGKGSEQSLDLYKSHVYTVTPLHPFSL